MGEISEIKKREKKRNSIKKEKGKKEDKEK